MKQNWEHIGKYVILGESSPKSNNKNKSWIYF